MEEIVYKIGLVILLGIPASGKTTLCRALMSEAPVPTECIGFDELLSTTASTKGACRKERLEGVERRIQCMVRGTWKGIVILDYTMHLGGMRKPYWKLFKTQRDVAVSFVQLVCPLAMALDRDGARAERVGESSIRNIHNTLKPLSTTQLKFAIQLDTTSMEYPLNLWPLLLDTLTRSLQYKERFYVQQHPLAPSQQNPVAHAQRLKATTGGLELHQANLALNRVTTNMIVEMRKSSVGCERQREQIDKIKQCKKRVQSRLRGEKDLQRLNLAELMHCELLNSSPQPHTGGGATPPSDV